MQPIRISYHGLEPSDALNDFIRTRAAQLDHISAHVQSLRVIVDAPHHRHRNGNGYDVRVELRLQHGETVIGCEPAADDPYVAVRCAFDAIRRQLKTTRARQLGKQRAHRDSHPSIRIIR